MPVPDYQSLMLPALEALSGSVEVLLSKAHNHGHRCDHGRCLVKPEWCSCCSVPGGDGVGSDQAPDFVIPNEFNPKIVIEAKLTEDDGTARDKVTRVQHLGSLSMEGQPTGQPKFEVIACIAGRGFGVRREDMKKLILATRGKVFTLQNMRQLVESTRLTEFRSQ